MVLQWLLASSIVLASSFVAGQFPPKPEGVTTKQITSLPGVSISYKETYICETSAKAWAGYVNMPTSYLEDIETAEPYNISMFFWYFEARNNPQTAPTAIYLAGGPGESSMFGAVSDGGPCYINDDSNSTSSNPWSWNENVNMLYIDQPVGAGFSYDALIKSTVDLTFNGEPQTQTGILPFEAWGDKLPAQNATFKYGILPSQDPNKTANSTGIAAITLWHFSQVWFSEFPEWRTCDKSVSLWGNSYAGYWVPATAAYMGKQNAKIKSGEISGTIINLDTIGLTNGCVDALYNAEFYPIMAYNNTYGLEIINKTVYEESLALYFKPKTGCRDLIVKCRALGDQYDPDDLGISNATNTACLAATEACLNQLAIVSSPLIQGPPRSPDDMAHLLPESFPPQYPQGYFNTEWVQKALGVPVNFTADSLLSNNVILGVTGDAVRRAGMKDVEYLLNSGIKVSLIFGDRDQRCPWLGAEDLSLKANWTEAEDFRAAGYASVVTNSSYNGGVVRQHGNLSFARVFEAGHDVAVYQPETVSRIFNRVMFNKDVATGNVPISNNYSSSGPASSFGIKNVLPPSPPPNCYLWSLSATCTVDQALAVLNGTAEVVDYRVLKPAGGGGPITGGLVV